MFLEFIFQDNKIQEKLRLKRIYDFVVLFSVTIPPSLKYEDLSSFWMPKTLLIQILLNISQKNGEKGLCLIN